MTIKVIQTCDSCGDTRDLELLPQEGSADLIREGGKGGWAFVLSGKHLCVKCLKAAVNL